MDKSAAKSVLKSVRRSQVVIKFVLLFLFAFVITAAASYFIFRQVRLNSVQNDIQLKKTTSVSGTSEMNVVSPDAQPTPAAKAQPVVQPRHTGALPKTYRVQKGDTLSTIAVRFYGNKNRATEIARLNGVKGTTIYAGQTLKLPQNKVVSKTPVKKVASVQQKKTATVHVVKKGDSLWKISAKHYSAGKKWPTIYKANTKTIGKNPNLIYPKQKLQIPRK